MFLFRVWTRICCLRVRVEGYFVSSFECRGIIVFHVGLRTSSVYLQNCGVSYAFHLVSGLRDEGYECCFVAAGVGVGVACCFLYFWCRAQWPVA